MLERVYTRIYNAYPFPLAGEGWDGYRPGT